MGHSQGREANFKAERSFPPKMAATQEGFLFPERRQNGAFHMGMDSHGLLSGNREGHRPHPQFPRGLQYSTGARQLAGGGGGGDPRASLRRVGASLDSCYNPNPHVSGLPKVGARSC